MEVLWFSRLEEYVLVWGFFCQFCITHLGRKHTFGTAMDLQSDSPLCKMHVITDEVAGSFGSMC